MTSAANKWLKGYCPLNMYVNIFNILVNKILKLCFCYLNKKNLKFSIWYVMLIIKICADRSIGN